MSKQKTITVELTEAEARALSHLAFNSWQMAEEILPHYATREAASRAMDKLDNAIVRAANGLTKAVQQ